MRKAQVHEVPADQALDLPAPDQYPIVLQQRPASVAVYRQNHADRGDDERYSPRMQAGFQQVRIEFD